MKKLILSLVAAAMVATGANAQENKQAVKPAQEKPAQEQAKPGKTPADRMERQIERMDKEMGLSPEQKAKIKEIMTKRDQSRDELMKKYPDRNSEDFKKESRILVMESEKQIKAVFTPEQIEKQKKARDEPRERNKETREKAHSVNKDEKAAPVAAPAATPTVAPAKDSKKEEPKK